MIGLIFDLVYLAILAAALGGLWKTFEKMGKPGWAGIVPIYNLMIIVEIIGKPMFWVVLGLIPVVNIVVMMPLAEKFGKSQGFGIGMALLPFVFFPLLGFGDGRFGGAAAPATA